MMTMITERRRLELETVGSCSAKTHALHVTARHGVDLAYTQCGRVLPLAQIRETAEEISCLRCKRKVSRRSK